MSKEKYARYLKRKNNELGYHEKGSSRFRDSDMTKTYRCEWTLESEYPELFTLMSPDEASKYTKTILKSKFWKTYGKGKDVEVRFTKDMGCRTRTRGMAYYGLINLSPRGCSKYIIIHELVHTMGYMNHGRGFRIHLVKMVSRFLGREPSKRLKVLFKEAGLKMSKPRAPLTYDQWLQKAKQYDTPLEA